MHKHHNQRQLRHDVQYVAANKVEIQHIRQNEHKRIIILFYANGIRSSEMTNRDSYMAV